MDSTETLPLHFSFIGLLSVIEPAENYSLTGLKWPLTFCFIQLVLICTAENIRPPFSVSVSDFLMTGVNTNDVTTGRKVQK